MEDVLQFLGGIRDLSQPCIEDLLRVTKFKKFRRDEAILEIGQINRHLLLIKKGVLQCYSYVGDVQVPSWFFWELATVVSIGSFYDQLPSKERIVPLEDGEAYYITWEDYEYLCDTHLEFANITRLQLQKYLKIFNEHAQVIRKHTAEERYQWVLTQIPEMLQRVPLGLLASWLNMTPEHLSRIRSARA